MVLSIDALKHGTQATEIFKLKSMKNSEDNEVELRYLSKKEIHACEKIEAKALGTFEATQINNGRRRIASTSESKGKLNMEAQAEATYKKQKKAIAYALSVNTEVKEDDVDFPATIFDEIYEYVSEMNNMGAEVDPSEVQKELDSFPED